MRASDLLNIPFPCQCFILLQAARKAGKRQHLQPEPLKTPIKSDGLLGSFSLKFAVVKATSPDKSEGLKSTKEPVSLRTIILQMQSGMSATGNLRKNLTTTRFYQV